MKPSGFKKLFFTILAIGLSLVGCLLAFEVAYRLQVVDFYRPELLAFNPKSALQESEKKPTLLILGDSFSVGTESYANILRTRLPDLCIINSSIPGTGIAQIALIAQSRLRRFHPALLLYQIYVGNDLFDISYPTNWKTLSVARNLYWGLSSRFRSLAFLNYRLGQEASTILDKGYQPFQPRDAVYRSNDLFSPRRFLNNEPLMLKADPRLIEKQILLLEERAKDFEFLVHKLHWMESIKDPRCPFLLLVIPHACQVSTRYLERTRKLGALFNDEILVCQEQYPFVQHLQKELKNCIVINPLRLFREKEESGLELYWPNDIHLNPNGNTVLADYVASTVSNW